MLDVDALLVHWVPYVVARLSSITVTMDWTEFDADGQTTIMLSYCAAMGEQRRWWLTVGIAMLKDRYKV